MHEASKKFPPVEALSNGDLATILEKAPTNRLHWSSREKSAWNEAQKRSAA